MRLPLRSLLRRLPGVDPGSRSLHEHLLLWLLLPQLVLWIAAAFVTYHIAARSADRAIDRSLYQSSRALARQVKPIGSGLLVDFPRAAQDIVETDPDDRVWYMVSTPPGQFILGNRKLPPPPAGLDDRLDVPHFYDGRIDERPVRVAALFVEYGGPRDAQRLLVQLAKTRTSREELARQTLIETALPLSGLIALMSLIVWGCIRAGLAPLARLRDAVRRRALHDLAPIRLEGVPREVGELAGALNALLAEVQASIDARQRFVSDAAHQLRTPLAGLKGQTELALKEIEPAGAGRDVLARLERVHESATRSAHLVNQLLTLARAEPGAASEPSPVDLRALVRETTAEWVPRALQAGIDLGFDDAGDASRDLVVNGHAVLLREALHNAIDNAIRYAGRGAEATVRLHAAPDGRSVRIEVEDNGPGLADADRERAFERFFRAAPQGTGSGLGLAIVKDIVERHGGSAALEPVQPRGLRVVLILPRIAAPAATAPVA